HADSAPAGHYGGQCSNCHTSTDNWSTVQFSHTGLVDCQSCHANSASANHYEGQCSDCHTSTDSWGDGSVPHTFPIDHRGANGDCQTCHPGNNYATYTCYGCHREDRIIDKHQEEGITDVANCVRCHPTGREERDDD
ncbi:MAG: hypothetical protein ACK2VD_21735, partial [Anaerolineae bacterium]